MLPLTPSPRLSQGAPTPRHLHGLHLEQDGRVKPLGVAAQLAGAEAGAGAEAEAGAAADGLRPEAGQNSPDSNSSDSSNSSTGSNSNGSSNSNSSNSSNSSNRSSRTRRREAGSCNGSYNGGPDLSADLEISKRPPHFSDVVDVDSLLEAIDAAVEAGGRGGVAVGSRRADPRGISDRLLTRTRASI